MIVLIREGYDRSPAFRDLVDLLQQSNVIVFVQPASCAGGRIRSCLVSVNGSQRERHIRIHVDTHTSHEWLIATVAHELQHAVEIASTPKSSTRPPHSSSYRQIAFGRCREGLSEACETTRALATERQVLEELYRHMTRASLTALPAAGPTAPPSPRVRSIPMLDLPARWCYARRSEESCHLPGETSYLSWRNSPRHSASVPGESSDPERASNRRFLDEITKERKT